MRIPSLLLVGSLGLSVAAAAWALDDGENSKTLELPRLQGRVQFGLANPTPDLAAPGMTDSARLGGASVLGDYYFAGRQLTHDGDSSGFRATTGVFLGPRLGLWGGPAPTMLASSLVSVERQNYSLASIQQGSNSVDGGAAPYFGLGYGASSVKGGWGFNADLGMMAMNPGNAENLGRALSNLQSTEELVRDLHFSPVVQVGVSYLF